MDFIRRDTVRHYRSMPKILRGNAPYCEEQEIPNSKLGEKILFALLITGIILIGSCTVVHAYTASWYGTTGDTCDKWKHTTTANGEKFNENALTAASWKYRFGTILNVTNLRNKKHVLVRVTDRGPSRRLFRRGRIIDLSRGAFSKIADLREGVIPVRVVCLN